MIVILITFFSASVGFDLILNLDFLGFTSVMIGMGVMDAIEFKVGRLMIGSVTLDCDKFGRDCKESLEKGLGLFELDSAGFGNARF